ncbi:MAG: hypothetical protein HY012_04830 [Acidobacteria bacterium]|nr:hypothetical protein [Acidobacteriota bacterium]
MSRQPPMNRLLRVLLVLLCFELGVILVLIPWSAFWERNFFLDRYPQLIPVLLNSYLRGAISGLGLLDIWIAATLVRRRRPARSAAL